MAFSTTTRHRLCLPAILLCSMLIPTATAQTGEFAAQELQRQQERERALREQQERVPDVRLPPPAAEEFERLPERETPCFTIDTIVLKGDAPQFEWALAAADRPDDPATGRCLGSTGINRVMKRIQNAIIERGSTGAGIVWGMLGAGLGRWLLGLEEETALLWIALPIFVGFIPFCIFVLPKHLRKAGIL